MSRLLVIALAVALAAPVRAQDAPPAPAEPNPPGRAVELQEGQPAPYTGSLVDAERAKAILAKRVAVALERDALRLSEQDARARQAVAERERDGRPSWGTLIGVTGAALVLGIVAGVVGVVVVQDRAR